MNQLAFTILFIYWPKDEEIDFLFHSNRFKNELMHPSGVSIEIPINGIFHRNSILAYFNDPQYRR